MRMRQENGEDEAAERRQQQRRAARARRRRFLQTLARGERQVLEAALAALVLPHLGEPGILGSHAAFGDEIDTRPIERAAAGLGWRIAFPRVAGGPLDFHLSAREALVPGTLGIPEPPATAPLVRPDVLLVPLLAVDRDGNRLGQGGGHFDRTLAALRASGPVLSIGLCFEAQLLDRLAARHWDQPLDAVATPAAFYLAAHRARAEP